MPDDNMRDLDRYWDAMLSETESRTNSIDPEIERIVTRFHAASDVDGIDSSDIRRIWSTLMQVQAQPSLTSDPPNRERETMQHAISLGLPQRNDLPWQRVHPSITKFVAAALIVLALIGTMLASNWWSNHGSEGLGGAPSIMAPSTPQVKTDEDLVVEFTLPASVIPVGEEVAGGAGTYFIPPGTSSEWGPDCETCTAFLIDLVVTGTLEIQPAAAVQVIRANGTVEEHPANADIVLTQGDAILTRIEIGAQVTNSGTETVELYSWILIGPGTDFGGRTLSGWSEGNFDIHQIPYLVPADTVVRIRRGTVDDGAEIEFAANGQTFIAAIGEGTKQTRPGEGTQKIYGEVGKPVPVYILTIEQPGVATPVPSTPTPTP